MYCGSMFSVWFCLSVCLSLCFSVSLGVVVVVVVVWLVSVWLCGPMYVRDLSQPWIFDSRAIDIEFQIRIEQRREYGEKEINRV